MDLNDRAVLAASNEKLKNDLIGEYRGFILACASRTLKRGVTDSDDEFITAMLAFGEAIDRYDKSRGSFTSFASFVIRNRLIDEMRRSPKLKTAPFSSLEKEGGAPFDAPAPAESDIKWEIEALTAELDEFGISFFELAEVSPKSRKTKKICREAVKCAADDKRLLGIITKKHILPVKEITERTALSRKTLERHRKYIIAAVIIVTGDYPEISEYFREKEV